MKSRIQPTVNQKRIIRDEVRKQISESVPKLSADMTALVLWVLHEHLGFGKKRLKRFQDAFLPAIKELQDYYELPTAEDAQFLCRYKLEQIGYDVKEIDTMFPMYARIAKDK